MSWLCELPHLPPPLTSPAAGLGSKAALACLAGFALVLALGVVAVLGKVRLDWSGRLSGWLATRYESAVRTCGMSQSLS